MRTQEIMTRDPASCTPDDTAQRAAELMKENDCGAIPVVDGDSRRLIGMVTDRDIAVRGVARGRGSDARVEELMSRDPQSCGPDDDVREVEKVMKEHQVRRVPIIDGDGSLVGIVAQADLALDDGAVDDREVGEIVEQISESGRKVRAGRSD